MPMDTRSILERLVAFASVSRNPNQPLIDWVRNWLLDHGIESVLAPGRGDGKLNLYARIGPDRPGGVVLSGHTDVVPIDGQCWNSDPFALTERDGRLHGRGAADMKGFIASALSRVPAWAAANLERPVHLALSCDEEVGCLGAPALIAAMAERAIAPVAVIVGEPTGLRPADRHKGIRVLKTIVRGSEGHSSLTHRGISAVMLAGELVARIAQLARERPVCDRAFVPPHTSASVNAIHGGTAINMFAAECEFVWDLRSLPQDAPDEFVEQVMTFATRRLEQLRAAGIHCRAYTEALADVPSLAPCDGAAMPLVSMALDGPTTPIALPFASEAGQFQAQGWSTVVCGPGSIEQAHQPDEYIRIDQLAACDRFLARVIAQRPHP